MRKSEQKREYYFQTLSLRIKLVTRFVNNLMLDGKKSLAFEIFYRALEIVKKKLKKKSLEVWKKALQMLLQE